MIQLSCCCKRFALKAEVIGIGKLEHDQLFMSRVQQVSQKLLCILLLSLCLCLGGQSLSHCDHSTCILISVTTRIHYDQVYQSCVSRYLAGIVAVSTAWHICSMNPYNIPCALPRCLPCPPILGSTGTLRGLKRLTVGNMTSGKSGFPPRSVVACRQTLMLAKLPHNVLKNAAHSQQVEVIKICSMFKAGWCKAVTELILAYRSGAS